MSGAKIPNEQAFNPSACYRWCAELEAQLAQRQEQVVRYDKAVAALEAQLEEWTEYFGCDSPHDTFIGRDTLIGKEQARANKAEAQNKALREALTRAAEFVGACICSESSAIYAEREILAALAATKEAA
jgi:hypothetical protein